jgi:hypothetical protein
MGLYEMTSAGALTPVASSTFATEQVMERTDLQRAIRDGIGVLGADLLVVAEEFGDFDVRRRIDLLCVDRTGRLVVVELKRTEDGGHLELQALRYAAMVSAMTFEQLVDTYRRHLTVTDPVNAEGARAQLADWLEDLGGESAVLERQVRIILASAGFDTQITTTVLWLNDVYGLDIMCVRLTPYRVAGKLLLDVQQVIPLPEAAELTVQLRRRETAARAAEASGGRDLTQYVIITPAETSTPLPKRRAVLALVTELQRARVPVAQMAKLLPGAPRLLAVEGRLTGEALEDAVVTVHPKVKGNLHRWFLDGAVHDADQTWVLSKMWGSDTTQALDALLTLAPEPGFGYEAA